MEKLTGTQKQAAQANDDFFSALDCLLSDPLSTEYLNQPKEEIKVEKAEKKPQNLKHYRNPEDATEFE